MKTLKSLIIICVIMVSIAVFQSCNNDTDDNTARIQIQLVDEPGDYLEVNIEIIDIQYNSSESEEGWTSFTLESPINVDLTELIAGNSLLLVDQIIPSGMLKQIRLVLSDNNTLVIEAEEGVASEPIHLNTPSAQQSGLKLNLNEELIGGFTYTFILDWVVQESVVEAGNSGMYNLKPVIKVNAEVNSGSIGGMVNETIDGTPVAMEGVNVEVYTLGDLFVTDTSTDAFGNFLIQGLEGGNYKLKISLADYQTYESELIEVTVGDVIDAGIIEMMLSD